MRLVLAVGSVCALAAACGPLWVARGGVLIAVATALVAAGFAAREIEQLRTEYAGRLAANDRANAEQSSQERQRTAEVLETLRVYNARADSHNGVLRTRLERTKRDLATAKASLSELSGINGKLRADLDQRQRHIEILRRDLHAQKAALRRLHQQRSGGGTVTELRGVARADWDAMPTAEEVWSSGNHPSIADLQKLAFPPAAGERTRKHA